MSSAYDAIHPADREVLKAIAAANDDLSPRYLPDVGGSEERPGIVEGRLVHVRVHRLPRKLDARGLDALVSLETYGEGLRSIALGGNLRLELLDLGEQELKSIDLGGCPALRKLRVDQNGLTELLGLPPSLVELDASQNPLGALDVAHLSLLEILSVRDCGLEAIEVRPLVRLRELDVGSNRLARIDLSTLTALESVNVAGNLAAEVLWPDAPRLSRVWAGRTRIEELDARRYPSMRYLSLEDCGLRTLRVSNPALESLDVTGNALEALDLSAAPRLSRLRCGGNPLRRIDVTGLSRLESASFPDDAEIVCTELQKHVVPELRARFGLPRATTVLAKMDGYQLHRHADGHNWDDGIKRLHDIVHHPACDLATALLVYWLGEPGEHSAWRDAASAPRGDRKTVALLRAIEERVASGAYATRNVPFDVRDVGGVDLSDDDPAIPAVMREPVRVAAGAIVVAPPLTPSPAKGKKVTRRGPR